MPVYIDITAPPDDLDKLVEDATPDLEALDNQRMVRRLASRERALQLSDIMLTSWSTMAELIDVEVSPPRAELRKAELARLDARAWVFYALDLAADDVHGNVNRKKRNALAKAVKVHDKFLFKWATAFFGDDPNHAMTLRDISRGTGLRDDAEDVLRLVSLYLNNPTSWNEIQVGDKKLDNAYLKSAHADATKQLDYLRSGMSNPIRILADAAYSLWFFDYDELMQLGRYLTRRQPDSKLRFPGVRELPTFLEAVEEEEEDEDDGLVEDDELVEEEDDEEQPGS